MAKLPRYTRRDLEEAADFHKLMVLVLSHKLVDNGQGETVCEVCQLKPRRKGPSTWPCQDHLIAAEYLKSQGFIPGTRLFNRSHES